jgi:dihydrofolate reductase
MKVSLIVAMAEGGVIGRAGRLPWHLPADMARFKRLTMDHHLIMGRRTWESIGRALPGRRMLVVSRRATELALPEGVRGVSSLAEALQIAEQAGDDEAFVAGGGAIYRDALPRADRLYLTWVRAEVTGDTFFPPVDPADWREVVREEVAADDRNPHATSFTIFDRK